MSNEGGPKFPKKERGAPSRQEGRAQARWMRTDRQGSKKALDGPSEAERIAERIERVKDFKKFKKGLVFRFRNTDWIVTGPMDPSTGFVPYKKLNGKKRRELDTLRSDPNELVILREADDTEQID